VKALESNVSTGLRWVRGDVDKHIEKVRLQIENVASNPNAGAEAVTETVSNIEFLKFTLAALSLHGAETVTDEMIRLCEELLDHKVHNREKAFSALMDAIVVIPPYLDRLQAGHQDLPILLLPVINGLRTAHDASVLQESAVFAPDLDVELPELKVDQQASTRNESFASFAGRIRNQYENALLNWLQEQDVPEHLGPLQGICETLLHRLQRPHLRRLWWVASEVIGGLARGFARNDAQMRRLLARLHLNLKGLAETGEDASDPRTVDALTRAFLYQAAGSRKGHRGLDGLRKLFRLESLMPDQEELLRAKGTVGGRDREMYASLGEAMQDELALVKDALDLELRTGEVDQERREVGMDALGRLLDTLRMLGLQGQAKELENLLPALETSRQGDAEQREAALMSLASQLLLVESALNEQIETLGEPLEQKEEGGTTGLPAHELRRIREHLLDETVNSVRQFQDAVKARFGGDDSADLAGPLQDVAGALQMLDEKESAELALRLVDATAYLLRNAYAEAAVAGHHLATFTDAVVSLEMFLAASRDHQGDRDRFLHILRESLDRLPDSPEAELAAAAKAGPALAEHSAIETVRVEPAAAEDKDALPPEMDKELLEVFIEEYESVSEAFNLQIPTWLEQLDNVAALTEIRRGFHTLKGSGRMVGAYELGDFCWQIEALLNALLDRKIDVYADAAVMVRLAQAALPALKQRMMQQSVGLKPEAIRAIGEHAERLERGEGADWAGLRARLPAFLAGMLPAAADMRASPGPARPWVDEASAGLHQELRDNLPAIQKLLEQASTNHTTRATREHLRAIHAVAGALAGSPERRDAEVATALEGMIEAQSNSGERFQADTIWTLGSALGHLQARLDRLEGHPDIGGEADPQHLIDQIIAQTVHLESPGAPAAQMPSAGPEAAETAADAPSAEEPDAGQAAGTSPQAAELEEEQAQTPERQPVAEAAGDEDESELLSDIVSIFLEEANEVLARSDTLLNTWRDSLHDLALVKNLQREIHTFKGGARMAGLPALGDLSHAMESLLESIAGRSISPSASAIQLLETGCDHLQAWVGQVTRGHVPDPGGIVGLFEQQVADLANVQLQPAEAEAAAAAEPRETHDLPEIAVPALDISDERSGGQIRVDAELLDSLVNAAGEVSIFRSRLEQQVGNLRSSLGEFDETIARLREQFRKLEIETEAQIRSRFQDAGTRGKEGFDPLELDRFSSMQQLSRSLSESVSDLLNLQEMLDEAARQADNLLTQQSRFTTELQEGLMKTRMVPFGSVAPRLRRLVRSAAAETGKKARLQLKMIGTGDQIDRNVLERITAPLEHMLRNAIAHGIEKPEQRRKSGKQAEGEITVTVESEATEFIIRIMDDGAGINLDAIREKAVKLGKIGESANPPPQQLYEFILDSGFSTSATVTGLAGRGVGMDVVNSEIKQIGGSLEIDSEAGKGSCFTIRIPFTLAVMQAIGVRAGENRYLVPLTSVAGVARLLPDDYRELAQSAEPAYVFAGERYPIMELEALLGEPVQPLGGDNVSLLLIRAGEQKAAFRVPELLGHREIVIKPVGPQISSVPGILGGTVSADGRVVVILDAGPLIRHALIHGSENAAPAVLEAGPRRTLVMVVDDSITMRKVTSRVLESHDYEVITAKDGIDATDQMKERVPDLILLDIEMPRMDGYEVASWVRSESRLKHVPIMMITSRSGQKHRERAAEVGANAYLTKPYKESELISNVRELVRDEARA